MLAVLMFVCAAVVLNWTYNNRWGKPDAEMVYAEDQAMLEADTDFADSLLASGTEYFAEARLTRQVSRDEALELLQTAASGGVRLAQLHAHALDAVHAAVFAAQNLHGVAQSLKLDALFLGVVLLFLPGGHFGLAAAIDNVDLVGTQTHGAAGTVHSHVAAAGDHHGFPGKAVIFQGLEHFGGEVAQAIAGGLGPGERTAEGQALAGEHSGLAGVFQPLVLAEEIADLPCTHADITGGHIGKLANVTVQLRHKALAEAHDLGVRLALGVKVAAALAAADGQAGETVLQDLLKAQKFQDGQVYRRVEPQAALVGADGGVELHPVAAVHMDLTGIVSPRYPEGDDALRLHEPFQNAVLLQLGTAFHHGLQALQNFIDRLMKLLLVRVTGQNLLIDALAVFIVQHRIGSFQILCAGENFMLYLIKSQFSRPVYF